jgi:hypothetical protein
VPVYPVSIPRRARHLHAVPRQDELAVAFDCFANYSPSFQTLVIVLKINIEDIFALKPECDSPVSADTNAPRASAIALELVQSITGQVHVSCCARVVEDVELSS